MPGNGASSLSRCTVIMKNIFLINYTFLSSSNTVYRNQSTPLRFFSRSSPVIDFPKGNLDGVANLLFYEEIIAVMYYAPWCSKSMWAKNEYEKAATYLQDEVILIVETLKILKNYQFKYYEIIIIINFEY